MSADPTGFAVRFLPRNKRDPSPALYLSSQRTRRGNLAFRLTSETDICDASGLLGIAYFEACHREVPEVVNGALVADVVPLADALRDLAS